MELKFKGTKGEWEVTQMLNVISKENGKMICATQSNMNYHEIKSNIKLIAAAPDLLEALQLVRENMTANIPEYIFDKVDKAIEKAVK